MSIYLYFSAQWTNAGETFNYTLEKILRAQVLDPAVYDPVTRPENVVLVSVSFHLLSIEKLVSVIIAIVIIHCDLKIKTFNIL